MTTKIVIETVANGKQHIVTVTSNDVEVKRGKLTDYERRLLQYMLDADSAAKEGEEDAASSEEV